MSHEVMITRGQRILSFFAYPGRTEPQKSGASWCWLVLDAEAQFCLDMQKIIKSFVLWLSWPHGTSNFDCLSWICSTLNYTNIHTLKYKVVHILWSKTIGIAIRECFFGMRTVFAKLLKMLCRVLRQCFGKLWFSLWKKILRQVSSYEYGLKTTLENTD